MCLFGFLSGCAGAAASNGPRQTPSPASGCASEEWTVIRNAHFGQSALSIMFVDASFGVGADLGGNVFYSEDGGETWTTTIKAGLSRAAIDISEDARRIWYLGIGGDLEISDDRGRTWNSPGPFPYIGHVEYLSFADDLSGWGVSTEQRNFFSTADGGKSWKALPLPDGMGAPAALHLRTPDAGYILDTAGSLFISADGGKTWTNRPLNLPAGKTIPTLNHSAVVRFSDALHGVAVVALIGGGEGLVRGLRTADGGATWTEEPVPAPMGMFHLTRDGVYLTHMDLYDNGKITLLCSSRSVRAGG
jgi:hypothetical protein